MDDEFPGGLIGDEVGFFGDDNVSDDGYVALVVDATVDERVARSRLTGFDCEA
jgi:hypothetical protein